MTRDRVLVEGDTIAYGIAGSILAGQYERGDCIIHRGVRLEPVRDHKPVFFVDDRRSGDPVGIVNAGAVSTAAELRELVDEYADDVDPDR